MRKWMATAVIGLIMPMQVQAGPLQVYILSGQSNMQGHAHVSTFDYIGRDPETVPLLERMRHPDGTHPVLDRVHISYLSENRQGQPTVKSGPLTVGFGVADDRIGPEYTFGIFMQDFVDEPILIIKTAWGGKSLFADFRPPSGATDEHPVGAYYTRMMDHIRAVLSDPGAVSPHYDPAKGFEIAGFVWFQGWNDLTNSGVYPQRGQPGGYDVYSELLAHLIRDVRIALQVPDVRFVIGVLGVGGPTEDYTNPRFKTIHQNFRDAMAAPAALPEFAGTVVTVLTEKYWDHRLAAVRETKAEDRTDEEQEIARGFSNQGFHYLGSGKMFGQFGRAFAEAMAGVKTERSEN